MIAIVDATLDHFLALYDTIPKATVRGMAAVEDGRVLGVCGFYMSFNQPVVFLKATDDLLRNPRVFIHGWKKLRPMLGNSAFALCDEDNEKASCFMQHFGFYPIGNGIHKWQMKKT